MGCSRQESWSGLPGPPPGTLPTQELNSDFRISCTAGRFFTTAPPGSCRGGKTFSLPILDFLLKFLNTNINKRKRNILLTHAAHITREKLKGKITQKRQLSIPVCVASSTINDRTESCAGGVTCGTIRGRQALVQGGMFAQILSTSSTCLVISMSSSWYSLPGGTVVKNPPAKQGM